MTGHFQKTVTIKAVDEENRTATGAVLVPNELDHQGDFFRPDAIERFYDDDPETGVMHSAFPTDAAEFERLEVVDEAETIDGEEFPGGTLIGTRRYEDDDLWQLVSDGVLTGFSIGGEVDDAAEHGTIPDDVRIPDDVDASRDDGTIELVDGTINEVSDVDIPAVPRATYKGGGDLGKAIMDEVDGEAEFISIMTEERGHSEADARRLYQYLDSVRDGDKEARQVTNKNIDDPAYGMGDPVQWTWQGEPVHGRVADIGEEFTVSGNTITGEEGEAVYLIHDWDEEAEAFDVEGTAKPQSSLSESDMDMPTVDEADTKAGLLDRVKAALFGSDDGTVPEAQGASQADDETPTEKDAPAGDTADADNDTEDDMTDDDTEKSDEPPAWADDLTEKVESIDKRVTEMEEEDEPEKALDDAPEWAQSLAEKVDGLDERVEAISKQSGHSQQLGKSAEEETEKSGSGFTLDPRKEA